MLSRTSTTDLWGPGKRLKGEGKQRWSKDKRRQQMRAAWYEKIGPAGEALQVGEMPDPEPGAGEVRVRIHASGVNPSDWKTRSGLRPMTFPRVIPHSDGAGIIDRVGLGVRTAEWGSVFGPGMRNGNDRSARLLNSSCSRRNRPSCCRMRSHSTRVPAWEFQP